MGKEEIKTYLSNCTKRDFLVYISLFPIDSIDLTQIQSFLINEKAFLYSQNSFDSSLYIKLLCLYDFLTYKKSNFNGASVLARV